MTQMLFGMWLHRHPYQARCADRTQKLWKISAQHKGTGKHVWGLTNIPIVSVPASLLNSFPRADSLVKVKYIQHLDYAIHFTGNLVQECQKKR